MYTRHQRSESWLWQDRFGRASSTPKSPTLLLAAMSKYTIASHEIKSCAVHVLNCSFLCRVAYQAIKPSCLSRLIICINNWSWRNNFSFETWLLYADHSVSIVETWLLLVQITRSLSSRRDCCMQITRSLLLRRDCCADHSVSFLETWLLCSSLGLFCWDVTAVCSSLGLFCWDVTAFQITRSLLLRRDCRADHPVSWFVIGFESPMLLLANLVALLFPNSIPTLLLEIMVKCAAIAAECPVGSNLADLPVATAWQEEAQPLRSVDEYESLEWMMLYWVVTTILQVTNCLLSWDVTTVLE